MLASKLLSPIGNIGNTDKLYVDDVFSAYTYTGNGSTQTINNGIDLAGKGGLVWKKARNGTWGTSYHHIVDTARGPDNILSTNVTDSSVNATSQTITAFSSSGFSLGTAGAFNGTGSDFISWTFRKAPKFFDVVTYTGNGSTTRSIPHSLGVAPGMVLVKSTSNASNWCVWHKNSDNAILFLEQTAAATSSTGYYFGNSSTQTSSDFCVLGAGGATNASGQTYVAYLFAHDPSADGIVQCGSSTTDDNGTATVSLGWEPQYTLIKRTDSTSDWMVYDTARDFNYGNQQRLRPNLSDAEGTSSTVRNPTATGFSLSNGASATYIYLAIRRPNKPPTTGTQVYNGYAYSGNGVAGRVLGTEIVPDMVIANGRNSGSTIMGEVVDRLRGGANELRTPSTGAEVNYPSFMKFDHMGVKVGAVNAFNENSSNSMLWAFRRAPGFFDVVCYTGTGSNRTVNHSLGVAPELVIVKQRSGTENWWVYSSYAPLYSGGPARSLGILTTGAFNYNPTSRFDGVSASNFSVGSDGSFNGNGITYVAYLFASLPGISKVGTFTGNGSSQTINCGFSAGARFVLIKRTDAAGDWFVWDTARGIVSANDPHLSLNTTAAEVTSNDSVDPNSTGFIVNQVTATDINVTGSTYLYLAIA